MSYSIQHLKLIKVFYNISKLSAQINKLQAVNGTAHLTQISNSTYLFIFHVHTLDVDTIKVLFIYQLMHNWIVFKKF